MLAYTKVAMRKIIDDFKRFFYRFQIITYGIYASYLIYALISKRGILLANILLLALTIGYTIFFIYCNRSERKNKLRSNVKFFYKWGKRVIKLFAIGVTVYGIYQTAKRVTLPAVIFSAFMVIGFALEFLFEIVIHFVVDKAQFVYEALQADAEQATKPVATVGNFFKRMKGEEIEKKEPTKNRVILDELVATAKEEKKQLKKQAKLKRKEEKRKKKQNDIQEKEE